MTITAAVRLLDSGQRETMTFSATRVTQSAASALAVALSAVVSEDFSQSMCSEATHTVPR